MNGLWVNGAEWVSSAPNHVPAVWGEGDSVLWSEGESLIIAAPPGLGKTTLAQQLALARCGAAESLDVLGLMVTPDPDRLIVYVAADRPRQAQRSMRRMVKHPADFSLLAERMMVWPGMLPFDPLTDVGHLALWLAEVGAGTVIIDSLKDAFGDISDSNVGARANQAIQHVVGAGIEFCGLHHFRKQQTGRGGSRGGPRQLDDIHGSLWLTAGAGSVICLEGSPGDAIVELRHLKQPVAEVGPMKVRHDHLTGRSSVLNPITAEDLLMKSPGGRLFVKEAAQRMFRTANPSKNQIEKARRALEGLVREGVAHKVPSTAGGLKSVAVYERVIPHDIDHEVTNGDHGHPCPPPDSDHDDGTADHCLDHQEDSPLKGVRDQTREPSQALGARWGQ